MKINQGLLNASIIILLTAALAFATSYPGGGGGLSTLTEAAGVTTVSGHFVPDNDDEDDLGTTVVGFNQIFMGVELQHSGDVTTDIGFTAGTISLHAAGVTNAMYTADGNGVKISNYNIANADDMDFTVQTTVSEHGFHINDGDEEAYFGVPLGFVDTATATQILTVTVDGGGAETFAVQANVINLICTDAETIGTITGAPPGMMLFIISEDADCTMTDDDEPTAADAFALVGNHVGSAGGTLLLVYDGTSWLEIGRADS